jgi:hypothetical protein
MGQTMKTIVCPIAVVGLYQLGIDGLKTNESPQFLPRCRHAKHICQAGGDVGHL